MLIGLLAVDPHRLFLYWEVAGGNGLTLSLFQGSTRICVSRNVAAAGSTYFSDLAAGSTYRAELRRARRLVAGSSEVALPRDAPARRRRGPPAPDGAGSSFLHS